MPSFIPASKMFTQSLRKDEGERKMYLKKYRLKCISFKVLYQLLCTGTRQRNWDRSIQKISYIVYVLDESRKVRARQIKQAALDVHASRIQKEELQKNSCYSTCREKTLRISLSMYNMYQGRPHMRWEPRASAFEKHILWAQTLHAKAAVVLFAQHCQPGRGSQSPDI